MTDGNERDFPNATKCHICEVCFKPKDLLIGYGNSYHKDDYDYGYDFSVFLLIKLEIIAI